MTDAASPGPSAAVRSIDEMLRPFAGRPVPGGCNLCDGTDELRPVDGGWRRLAVHEDGCPLTGIEFGVDDHDNWAALLRDFAERYIAAFGRPEALPWL